MCVHVHMSVRILICVCMQVHMNIGAHVWKSEDSHRHGSPGAIYLLLETGCLLGLQFAR